MFVPYAQSTFSWRLSRTTGGIELSSLRFVPFEFVPLSTAAGVAGLTLTSSAPEPWTGLRPVASPADGMLVPYTWPDAFRPAPVSWMEAVVTGPAEIGWQQDYRRGFAPSEIVIDGVIAPFQNPPTASGDVYITVPAGTHTVRWVAEGGDSEAVAMLSRFRVSPVPAVYLDWRPGLPFAPPPSQDWDGDGLSNFLEYAFFMDPLSAASGGLLDLSPEMAGGYQWITLPVVRGEAEGVMLHLEHSPDLHTWLPAPVEAVPPAPPGRVRYRLPLPVTGESRRYLRARASYVFPGNP